MQQKIYNCIKEKNEIVLFQCIIACIERIDR
jgi:hypothetical protein